MNNPDLIEEIARITAHELTVSGHDWTFAPTLCLLYTSDAADE